MASKRAWLRAQLIVFSLVLLLLISCSPAKEPAMASPGSPVAPANLSTNTSISPSNPDPGVLPLQELYKFPSWVDGCDRFRPIFTKELDQYQPLKGVIDLPDLYSLVYQESMCKTAEELKSYDKEQGTDLWKGGIMQTDGCWRWGSPYNCSTVQQQIANGMRELNFSYDKIVSILKSQHLEDNLTARQKLTLLFLAYNRGYYVSGDAMAVYRNKLDNQTFLIPNLTEDDSGKFRVYVNCTEKDVCLNDYEWIDITEELAGFSSDFDKSLLISCRSNYGFMHNSQGDYCTGPSYGLMYPKSIFNIEEKITAYQDKISQDASNLEMPREKEFYIGDLSFSNYTWLVKKSIGKAGPGPNYFYFDNNSSYVDPEDRLHLNLLKRDGEWYSSEVILSKSLGYGEYSFFVDSDVSRLDKNVVLGLFIYDLSLLNQPNYYHREIDIEMAKWGFESEKNTQLTVQGPSPQTAMRTLSLNSTKPAIFIFDWQPGRVDYKIIESSSNKTLADWSYSGDLVPTHGEEHTRINLWAHGGPPSDGKEQEIVISRFSFRKY
jgi:hypothetical protein